MSPKERSRLAEIVKKYEGELVTEWVREQLATTSLRSDLLAEGQLREQSGTFVRLFQVALQSASTDVKTSPWEPVRSFLDEISRNRARQGFSPGETATFVFSFKQPLFHRLRNELGQTPEVLTDEMWSATTILDRLGLHTTESYQTTREEVIHRQQSEILELSTPVVQLWDGILALPMIGTLDSSRTQTVMESLLQRIVETGSQIAIIDITGVPTVDTLTAQHLLKTVTATRLMGADCIISGVRPQIAQTLVHLGVNLGDIITKSTLAAALALALDRMGKTIVKKARAQGA
jgi:rsbT co-antagonist protein RsbR